LLLAGLSTVDGGGFLTLRLEDDGLLLTFTREDGGTLVTLGLHLLLHGRKHTLRRSDVLQFHTVHLNAPLVGRIVEHSAQFGVDGVAGGKCLVEFHFTNDVTQGGLRKFFNGVWQIVDFINSLEWIYNLEIKQGIDLHLDVIFRDYVLAIEIVHLFAQINSIAIHVAARPHGNHLFGAVDKRNDEVDARTECGEILTEPFDDLGLALRNDDYGLLDEDECQDDQCNEHVT